LYANNQNFPQGYAVPIKTWNNQNLFVYNSLSPIPSPEYPGFSLSINDNVSMVSPDVLLGNGVVHGINRILIPSDFQMTTLKVMIGYGNYKLVSALQRTTLDQLFDGSADLSYTIFAPSDAALSKLGNDTLSNLLALTDIMELHIVKGPLNQIKEKQAYAPLYPGYLLVGGPRGESIICVNLTYYHANVNTGMNIENNDANGQTLQADGKKRALDVDEVIRVASLTPGAVYEAKITSYKVGTNGIVYQIDGVFGLQNESSSIGKWIILAIVLLAIILIAGIAFWLYRRRQQQDLASRSSVRLLD